MHRWTARDVQHPLRAVVEDVGVAECTTRDGFRDSGTGVELELGSVTPRDFHRRLDFPHTGGLSSSALRRILTGNSGQEEQDQSTIGQLGQRGSDVDDEPSAKFESQHAVAELLLADPQVAVGHQQ